MRGQCKIDYQASSPTPDDVHTQFWYGLYPLRMGVYNFSAALLLTVAAAVEARYSIILQYNDIMAVRGSPSCIESAFLLE